jgi:DNA-binding transcriptional LysR family regulator
MATSAQVGELELGLLRMFLAVVEKGSIGKAAAAVDMTQPAVSQQMLRLEKILGQKLFARGRNGVTLTRHGEVLVTYANRAVELNEEILLRLREEKTTEQVIVGTSADVAFVGLIPGLTRMQTIRPELELKVVVAESDKLNAMLRTNEIDLAIANPKEAMASPLATWEVQLFWAARKQLQVDKSKTLPLVLFNGPCHWPSEMLNSLREAGWEYRISFESPSLDAVLTATQYGLGVSALSMERIRKAKLVQLSDSELPPAPILEFGLFSGITLSNSARTVLEVAKATISGLRQQRLDR